MPSDPIATKSGAREELVMDELEALQTCIDALYALTPEERDRAMRWLGERVYGDLDKEKAAATTVGKFLWAMGAPK